MNEGLKKRIDMAIAISNDKFNNIEGRFDNIEGRIKNIEDNIEGRFVISKEDSLILKGKLNFLTIDLTVNFKEKLALKEKSKSLTISP
ncbi:hypothetical protein RclHR1_05350012 [Rhizophagus clarus]|uniref:Uncharacterized protein n=1 Tax=Rhizophagus clarus TaxID=94130 RepID=A0A2Z6RLP5_9GLOM|nr:hypothetical protein RclHR1_05350012 [Rhizophagus clarus]GES90427.1 hypothetical protein GLOIN_2v1783343 [Rhizophagus clarus]